MTVAYRPAAARDRAFIVSGWSTSYRTSYSAGMIAMDDWSTVMHTQIEKVLDRPGCTTIVAHNPDDPDPIADLYGFIAADPRERYVFYVYVKHHHRRRGFARGLFGAVGIDPRRAFGYACSTRSAIEIIEAGKAPMAKWDPLPARYDEQRRTPIVEIRR